MGGGLPACLLVAPTDLRPPRVLPDFRPPAWVALMGRAAVCAGGRQPAREIATREPDGSEWSFSRPALALPPPTGTAARPRRPRGGLQSVGVSVRCSARPRRPPAPRRGPAACSASYPGYRALITEPTANFACNSPGVASGFELCSLVFQRFQALLKLHPIELRASFLRGGCIGACWCRSGSPLAKCAVVWNRRRLCSWLLASGWNLCRLCGLVTWAS